MTEGTQERYAVLSADVRRGHLYLVAWDDGTEQELDRRVWDESGYRVGSKMTEEEREALRALSATTRAKERALWLLSRRDYSQKELAKKLREKADTKAAAEQASARMEELGLVDDERYAQRLAHDLCFVKHYPCRRAREALTAKGIDRETARAAVENCGSDDVQQALALLQKKCYTAKQEENARRRIRDSLIRYGFSYDTVREATALAEGE